MLWETAESFAYNRINSMKIRTQNDRSYQVPTCLFCEEQVYLKMQNIEKSYLANN